MNVQALLLFATLIATKPAAEVMPIFEVRIGGGSYWFLIDTGSSYNFLDERIARKLGFTPRDAGTVRGAGGASVKVQAIDGVAFTLGETKTTFDDVRLTDLSGLESLFGHRIDGFFGYPLLERFVVTIDPKKQRIVLTEPAKFRHDGKGVVLPLRFGGRTNRWIYAPATVKYRGIAPVESQFFIDSGSLDAVNHPAIRRSKGPLRQTRTGTGLGSTGAGSGVIGRAEWVRLGPFEVKNVESLCCGPLEGTEAMIGQQVLAHFVVTYDYSCKRMIVSD